MLDFVNLTDGYEFLLSVQNKIWFLDLVIKDLHKLIEPVKDQVLMIQSDNPSVTVLMSRLSFILLSPRKMKAIPTGKSRLKISSYLRKKLGSQSMIIWLWTILSNFTLTQHVLIYFQWYEAEMHWKLSLQDNWREKENVVQIFS